MRRRRDRFRRQLGDEFLNRAIGIEPHFLRVGADERAREDPAGQARQVAALERFERHHGNARAVGNLSERNAPLFARFAETSANGSGWGTLGHHNASWSMLGNRSAGVKHPAQLGDAGMQVALNRIPAGGTKSPIAATPAGAASGDILGPLDRDATDRQHGHR